MSETPHTVRAFLAEAGRKGGSKKSAAKAEAARRNGRRVRKSTKAPTGDPIPLPQPGTARPGASLCLLSSPSPSHAQSCCEAGSVKWRTPFPKNFRVREGERTENLISRSCLVANERAPTASNSEPPALQGKSGSKGAPELVEDSAGQAADQFSLNEGALNEREAGSLRPADGEAVGGHGVTQAVHGPIASHHEFGGRER
jgi:hypothetical protein